MIEFEYPEDQKFFEDLLIVDDFSDINQYRKMFDFRVPIIKRNEFNKIKNLRLESLKHIWIKMYA